MPELTAPRRLFLPTARQTNWLLVDRLSVARRGALSALSWRWRTASCRSPARAGSAPGCAPRFDWRSSFTTIRSLAAIALAAALLNLMRPSLILFARGARGGGFRRRDAQCRPFGARRRRAYPELGASRTSASMTARPINPAQNQTACQLAKRFVEHDVDGRDGQNRRGSRFGERRAVQPDAASRPATPETARPRRSAGQTGYRGSADRTPARAPPRPSTSISAIRVPPSAQSRPSRRSPAGQERSEGRRRPAGGASGGADDRSRDRNGGEGERAQPAPGAEAFNRAPSRSSSRTERRERTPVRRSSATRMRTTPFLRPAANAPPKVKAASSMPASAWPDPVRMIGDRSVETEFRRAGRTVDDAPIAADRAFERAFPGLIEGLDDVDPEIFALRQRHRFDDGARLVRRRRPRAFAHAAGARPAELADDDLLVRERRRPRCLRMAADMGGGARRRNRKVLPIRQDMDGDEIDRVLHVRIAQPKLPDVGIGDRHRHLRLDLADVADEVGRRHFAAQQHFVADDHGGDDVRILLWPARRWSRFAGAVFAGSPETHTPCRTFSPCRRALSSTSSRPSSTE